MTNETANAKDLVRFGGLTNTTNGMALANKMKAIVIANGMNAIGEVEKVVVFVMTTGKQYASSINLIEVIHDKGRIQAEGRNTQN